MSEGGEGYQPAQLPELQQREPLTDIQIGDLISSTGNHEGKALMTVAMDPGEIYTGQQLYKRMLEIQGDKPGWEISRPLPFNWCRESLAPIGLVAQEVTDSRNNSYGFTLTEYGETIGRPFSALMLDWSKRHPDISLNQLFANTMVSTKSPEQSESPQNRAPITRYKLLWELVTTDLPARTVDILPGLTSNKNVIGRHLQDLADSGIIEYTVASDVGKPYVQYRFNPEISQEIVDQAILTDTHGNRTFIKRLYDIVRSDPDKVWTRQELAAKLVTNEVQNALKSIDARLSTAIGILRNAQALQGIEFDYRQFSRINMTPEQRDAIVELLETIDSFQKQDPESIEKSGKLVQYFNTHPDEAAELMAKIYKASSFTNNLPPNAAIAMLTSIIQAHPNSDIKTIQQILKEEKGKDLKAESIRILLNRAAQEGKLVRTDNKSSFWNIASAPLDHPEEVATD